MAEKDCLNYNSVCPVSKNVYSSWAKEEEGEKQSLCITNELSVQQPCDYIIALGALNPTYVHRLTITT